MRPILSNLLIVESTPGREVELERHLTSFVLVGRQAEGCLNYDCYQSLEEATRFMLQIRWRDRESLDKHLASPELVRFLESSADFLTLSFTVAYRNFLPEDADQK